MSRPLLAAVIAVFLNAPAWAAASDASAMLFRHRAPADVWHVDFAATTERAAPAIPARAWTAPVAVTAERQQAPVHAGAIQHSDAYLLRAKIHRYASYASLPLFGAEVLLGESLYNSGGGAKKGAHVAVGTGLVGLFGINTVTGAWNLFGAEGRHDKPDRTLKIVHGLLMMAADAGFVGTVATAPGGHERFLSTNNDKRTMHRDIALTSIGLGTAGYLIMFLHSHF